MFGSDGDQQHPRVQVRPNLFALAGLRGLARAPQRDGAVATGLSSTAIRSALATASSNQIEGSAALAANAAVARIQAMTKAAATVNLSV